MAESFQDILNQLIKEHGIALLDNSARCNALLQDYTQSQFKKETRLLLHALEAGYYKELKNTQDPEITKQKLIQKFQDEYGSSEESADETISLLMGVLGIPNKANVKKIAELELSKLSFDERMSYYKTMYKGGKKTKDKANIPSTGKSKSVGYVIAFFVMITIISMAITFLQPIFTNRNNQIFVSHTYNTNVKFEPSEVIKLEFGALLCFYCVVSEKAYVYKYANNRDKLGFLVKYNAVMAPNDPDKFYNGFVLVYNVMGGSSSPIGWMKITDIMEAALGSDFIN